MATFFKKVDNYVHIITCILTFPILYYLVILKATFRVIQLFYVMESQFESKEYVCNYEVTLLDELYNLSTVYDKKR